MTDLDLGDKLWLDPIPVGLREMAAAAFEAGDEVGFLGRADNLRSLELVVMNAPAMRARTDGFYERALLQALIATRTNNSRWPVDFLRTLFEVADRDRLRAAGDDLPGPGPFTIYRGVGGRGQARRVRGVSWSGSEERARWFADGARRRGFHDPAVYRVTVDAREVLAYLDASGRGEQDFLVLLPATRRPVRLDSPNSGKGGA